MTKGIPRGVKAQRKRDLPPHRGLACVVTAWFLGLPALPHSTSLPRRRGFRGRSPGDSAQTRLQCGTTLASVLQLQTARTATPGLAGGDVRTHTAGTRGSLCPRSGQRSTHSHRGTQLWRGLPPRLTSLLTARYSKAWLIIQGTAGLFWLTQFHQTTQWKTDSEQIKKVSRVKIFIYDSEGTSKFPRATGSLLLGHQPSCTGPMEKL